MYEHYTTYYLKLAALSSLYIILSLVCAIFLPLAVVYNLTSISSHLIPEI